MSDIRPLKSSHPKKSHNKDGMITPLKKGSSLFVKYTHIMIREPVLELVIDWR